MNIGIIGGGITGLTLAKLLKQQHNVTILEKESEMGGIAKIKTVEGVPYHLVGGHCFNSKIKRVKDFVFSQVLDQEEWRKIKRKSKIQMEGYEIDYPIEYSLDQIYQQNHELALKMAYDFFCKEDDGNYLSLEDWFKKKFGQTLAEKYFIPYNSKIWGRPISEMNHFWVKDKLPCPDINNFIKALFEKNEDEMPHLEFFYPKSGKNSSKFIDALAIDVNIILNFPVFKIQKQSNGWLVNNELIFDKIVNTSPLNELPHLIDKCPYNVINESKKLKFNKVSNALWESTPTNKTWTYYPSDQTKFHRHIHIGNFIDPPKNYTITEIIGEIDYETMLKEGSKFQHLIKAIDFNISEHAYVVFDLNYEQAVSKILDYLREIDLISVGRFGEWEYYNMDKCIDRAIEIANTILEKK